MLDDADILSDLDQLRSRYEVLRRVGNDGGCAVYAVRGRGSDERYLVKVMRKPGSGSAQAGTLHLWQAHTMARLEHPRLVVLHTVNHLQGGTLALAMERPRGQTLAERMESVTPLPVAEVESTLRDVAEALAYLHGRGVVHRGVNLDSILLDGDTGCARLAHFGIPRGERAGEIASDDGASLHQKGAYEATEQRGGGGPVRATELSTRSDLYSLGLVGYAILTGRDLSPGDSAAMRTPGPLPPLETLRAYAPPHLCRAIEGCLERDPRRRWRTAEEFLVRLDPSAGDPPVAPRPELSALLVGWGSPMAAIGTAVAGRWDSVRRSNVALALPAALLMGVAWAVLRPAEVPAPPASDREVMTTAVADSSASPQLFRAEPASAASGTVRAIAADLPTAGAEDSTAGAREIKLQPAADPAASPRPSAVQRRGRSRRADSRAAPGGQQGGTARRRPPVPLLGEELASADPGH
jgi:hypothetical protein